MSAKVLSDRAIVGEYYNRLEQGPTGWVGDLTHPFESSQDSEKHTWLGMPPSMREWIGGKQAKGFRDNQFEITNNDYESTIDYHRRHLTEDKTGQFQVRLSEHIQRVDAQWASLTSTLILNGASTACYDGQYFFDTDHSEGDSGTQSNDISVDISALPVTNHGSTTAPSVGELQQSIMLGVQQILGFVDDQGEPMNENAKRFLIMVPTALWHTAVAAVTSQMIDRGETNSIINLKGYQFDVVPNARLTWTDKFAVFRTDGSVKPFIRQIREEPMVAIKGEGSDYYFDTGRKQVSIEMAGNVGFGLWQHSTLVTMA